MIERVRVASPDLLALVAPAGFGKSTVVRQLLAGADAVVCDCRGVASDLDLARRLLPALAEAEPARSAALSQSETMLGDGHASAADRVEVALAAWRTPARDGTFVFENAEDAIAEASAHAFLGKLLAARPDGRTVIVCSREPLRMHLSRFAPPHRILTLRPADLAFTGDEVRAIFRATGAPAETVERVAAISAGWPIAVLLLARFAHEGRVGTLLDRLDDVAYEELHDYLADEVLGDASPAIVDGLVAAAAIPDATDDDVRVALCDPDALAAFLAFTKTSPFVTRTKRRTIVVHPLVASTLLERHAARVSRLLAPVAAAYEAAGDEQRAAEVHLAAGDQAAAAGALERIELIEEQLPPPIAYSRVLASLDHAVVLRHPRLWSVTALLRLFSVDSRQLLDEVESIWSRLPADAPPVMRMYLYVFRVLVLGYLGEFDTALRHVEDFRAQIGAPDVPQNRVHAWLLVLRGLMNARRGRTDDAERDLERAWPFISETSFMAGGTLVTLGADIARVRGDRVRERERVERAVATGRSTGFANFIAFYEAEATFGAWLAGDEPLFAHHALALDEEVRREGVRSFAFFAAAARGQVVEPQRADLARWIACGYLIAAADAADPATALRHVERARSAAAASRSPFHQVLAALAAAQLDSSRASALLHEAAAIAHETDATSLHDAVAAASAGRDAGFLEPFVRRYRARDRVPERRGLTVELVRGRVTRDGNPIPLAEREHALIAALATRAEVFSRERLTALLWPELPDGAARNAFHVCVHRLKARLGDDVVVRSRDGYRLRADVHVDLWEIDRVLATFRSKGAAEHTTSEELAEVYARLRASRPPKVERWEWFEPVERHLREARCEVAHALAKRALDEGRTHDALALCRDVIAYDPCDEPAREIAIRAYLAEGDRAAALRHYRQYRDVLQAELQCEPSAALSELVGAGV